MSSATKNINANALTIILVCLITESVAVSIQARQPSVKFDGALSVDAVLEKEMSGGEVL